MTPAQYAPEEPVSSIATALAPAALGIVRISGKNCIELVSKVFSRPRALLEAAGNTLVHGWIVDKKKDDNQPVLIDEVMLGVYRAPKSFTGEDMIEIFCHGGSSVVTAIQSLMLRSGFREANRGEYTFRAYINGKTDLTRAEAVREIIESRTDTSRSHAAGRLSGNLFDEIDSIKKLIVDTLAAIEVEIEYPEDEETIADSFDLADILLAADRLQTLADSWRGEKLYQDGARVVLAGRTNAGKSSLFNAILKEERAIVSEVEGTTRDWLESWAGINGIPVRLFDTAGLRPTEDVVEARGVELSQNLAQSADLVLYLVDGRFGMCDEDRLFLDGCTKPVIVVSTKADMISGANRGRCGGEAPAEGVAEDTAAQRGGWSEGETSPSCIRVSSKTGEGLSELFARISQILTAGLPTEREQAGLGSARQKDCVLAALESVRHAIDSADGSYTLDAVIQDLEDALDNLGEVTGDVTPDDVLGSIFANFCVGK